MTKPSRNGAAEKGAPCVAYYRMSAPRQQESVARQRERTEAYAAEHGFHILREYVDSGLSASDVGPRPAFARMAADVGQGDFQALLVYSLDRFSRLLPSDFFRAAGPFIDRGIVLV